MKTRKGIFQTFGPDGNMQADERWQIVFFDDGAVQIDAESIRLKPFAEPRSEAITLSLHRDLTPDVITIHALYGHREARVNFVDVRAMFCWQFMRHTHRAEHAWSAQHELGYGSTLFNTVAIWHSALAPGQSRAFTMAQLDPITFEPHMTQQTLTRLPDEAYATRFGPRVLQHYTIHTAEPASITQLWCDDQAIVYDLVMPDGAQIVLTAVNSSTSED